MIEPQGTWSSSGQDHHVILNLPRDCVPTFFQTVCTWSGQCPLISKPLPIPHGHEHQRVLLPVEYESTFSSSFLPFWFHYSLQGSPEQPSPFSTEAYEMGTAVHCCPLSGRLSHPLVLLFSNTLFSYPFPL